MKAYDLIIIGGGPAGLAAAVAARDNGIESILILERDKQLGGILKPCLEYYQTVTVLMVNDVRLLTLG